ncbi:unnamed protein product [Didymodactylos carnosus]|uniref:DED domain-containing protein n=1 Tax=Didymodactylos carnosus TaxID=1234261 RepID=A0A814FIT1_9BILA|nr:unnamed protein product [Didymodactylos carnosus]CAF0981198.1 unnamed protein product [Didymodactylos carnosus]CAF3713140.1 unnamed protein product [Didymodactylos carnosus]CAF3753751.1 unnamed protein product [Didymodactylos carnosus]
MTSSPFPQLAEETKNISIVAQPKSVYHPRYLSDFEKEKGRASRYIRAESPSKGQKRFNYPTIKTQMEENDPEYLVRTKLLHIDDQYLSERDRQKLAFLLANQVSLRTREDASNTLKLFEELLDRKTITDAVTILTRAFETLNCTQAVEQLQDEIFKSSQ